MGRAGAQWSVGAKPGSPRIQQVGWTCLPIWQLPWKESLPLSSYSCVGIGAGGSLRQPPHPLSSPRGPGLAQQQAEPPPPCWGWEDRPAWGRASPVLPLLPPPRQGSQPLPSHPQHWASGHLDGPFTQPGLTLRRPVPSGVRGRALDNQDQGRSMNFAVRWTGLGILGLCDLRQVTSPL